MADFVQTMKDWRRMCKVYTTEDEDCCKGCPVVDLAEHGCGAIFEEEFADVADMEELEWRVTKWAAEHQEPVYPTWGEWLESQGICFIRVKNYSHEVTGPTIPQIFEYQIDGETAFLCGDKVNSPIPADIAQKLGVKPKEG